MAVMTPSENAIGWTNSRTFRDKVFSSFRLLTNGWTATVTDDSEAIAPFRGTYYTVSAICRFWGIPHPEKFSMLEDARAAAIEFAAKMPKCNDRETSGDHCVDAWAVRDEYLDAYHAKKRSGL